MEQSPLQTLSSEESKTTRQELMTSWMHSHPKEKKFLLLNKKNTKLDRNGHFSQIRNSKHVRTVNKIKEFLEKQKSNLADLEKTIENRQNEILKKMDPCIYTTSHENMTVRKRFFLEKKLNTYKLQILEMNYAYIMDRVQVSDEIINLFSNHIIPLEIILSVDESLFVEFDPGPEKNTLIRLRAKITYYDNAIKQQKKPDWYDDFPRYFRYVVEQISKENPGRNRYLPPIFEEISLSRAVFSMPSKIGEQIDQYLNNVAIKAMEEFPTTIVQFCSTLYTPKDSKEASVAFLILYRIICDRIFERFPSLFAPRDDKRIQHFLSYCNLPVSQYELPKWIRSILGDAEGTLRDSLMATSEFSGAGSFALPAAFATNALDALAEIDRTLHAIHDVASSIFTDRARMMSFEECYPAVFCAILCSDIPDVFDLQDMVRLLMPRFPIIPGFEFAATNLEAVTVHLASPDMH